MIKYAALVTVVLGLLFLTETSGQQVYSVKDARSDLTFLRDQMLTYQPNLEAENPEFRKKANALIESLTTPLDAFELFTLVSKLAAYGNENHYGLGNWEDEVHKGFLEGNFLYFPAGFKVTDNKLFIQRAFENEGVLKPAMEILSINGLTVDEVLNRLYACIPSDGKIRSFQQRTLDISFPWMYYLYVERPESFRLEIKDEQGNIVTHTISALTRDQMVENVKNQEISNEEVEDTLTGIEQVYSFEINDQYALLTLRSFTRQLVEDYKVNSRKLYKEIFQELMKKGVEVLVVDLRDNSGGLNEFSDDILPYVVPEGAQGVFKISHSWEGKTREYKIPNRDKWAFEGTIYALVNGRTYSAASTFVRNLKEFANAIVVGEETGTRYEGFAAGSSQYVTLPKSGYRISIPRYSFDLFPNDKQQTTDRGILPDHLISYSIDVVIEKRDLELEYIESILKK